MPNGILPFNEFQPYYGPLSEAAAQQGFVYENNLELDWFLK